MSRPNTQERCISTRESLHPLVPFPQTSNVSPRLESLGHPISFMQWRGLTGIRCFAAARHRKIAGALPCHSFRSHHLPMSSPHEQIAHAQTATPRAQIPCALGPRVSAASRPRPSGGPQPAPARTHGSGQTSGPSVHVRQQAHEVYGEALHQWSAVHDELQQLIPIQAQLAKRRLQECFRVLTLHHETFAARPLALR
jgi:hypothetical protein